MRRSLPLASLAVSLIFLVSPALAQKKGKDKKADDKPSASATWSDPAESEKSDKGPFAPKTEGSEGGEEDAPKPEPKNKNAPDPGRTRDKIQLFGQIMIGFGKAPRNKPDYQPGCTLDENSGCGKGTAIGFQVGGRYDITPAFSGGLRVPVTTATVRQPNGKNLSTTAFGSPELFGEYRLSLSKLTSIPIGFGVGIPVAQGNPDITDQADTAGNAKDTVNRLADATSGWRDSELFQPKRLPVVVGGGIRHERQDWELHGDLKFVLLPALNKDVKVPDLEGTDIGLYKANAFALREVTTLGGTYDILSSPAFWAGLDLAIVWTPIETFDFDPAVDVNKPSSVQAVLEPRVGVRFKRFAPSLGYVAPLGGRLGDAGVGGVRLHLDVNL